MKTPSKKTILGILLLVVALALLAGRIYLTQRPVQEAVQASSEPETPAEGEPKAVNIAVQVLAPESVEETFTLPGTLEAWENLTLSLEQAGTIEWVGPREGDRLSRGEEILRMDMKLLEAQHARNRTDFELKKKQYDRARSLREQQLISEREYDEASNAYQSAMAVLAQSEIALDKSTLVSPINGILDSLMVDRGEYGNAGTPAARVVQVDRLKVAVDVPEKDVTAIRVGQNVNVLPADVNGSGLGRPGKVIHVAYLADESTRTYKTKVQIDNRDGYLRPGMIVRVRFVRRVIPDVLVIPLYTVMDRDGMKFVFVEEDGFAVRREVRLGPIIEGKVVVFGGVQAGENLVVKGQQLLADGGAVAIVDN